MSREKAREYVGRCLAGSGFIVMYPAVAPGLCTDLGVPAETLMKGPDGVTAGRTQADRVQAFLQASQAQHQPVD